MKVPLFAMVVSAAVCLHLTSCGTTLTWLGKTRGRFDAQNDLRRGRLALEIAGVGMPGQGAYFQLMSDRYGIEYRDAGGCTIGPNARTHVEAYDDVMEAEIKRQFGADVFERTFKDAQRAAPQ